MHVPFVDLKSQNNRLRSEIENAIKAILDETAFISGKYASIFERDFAAYIGGQHCIAVANGTDAIEIALEAIGIGPGDEVLVPANTWISTSEAVTTIGADPVFVDIDPQTYNIDPAALKNKITSRTKAIIAVHLYGLPADLDPIVNIAKEYGLKLVEDCAQAHGATYKGVNVGTFGDAATFSFYPSKNLGACGDAGAIVTNNAEVGERARLIANHGQAAKNHHVLEGRNSRMDGIQAAILSIKLSYLDQWIAERQRNAAAYTAALYSANIGLPFQPSDRSHTFHLYVVQVDDRDRVQELLSSSEIETAVHYPTSLPFSSAYSRFASKPTDYPISYNQMSRILSLPMYPELSESMIEYVCKTLKKVVN